MRPMVPGWVMTVGQAAPALCWMAGQLWEMKLQQTKMAQLLEQVCERYEAQEQGEKDAARINEAQDRQIQRLLIHASLER
jgi:hypothetical protein